MSRIDDLVDLALGEGWTPAAHPERPAVGEPRIAAAWRDGDRGVVLLLVYRRDGTAHALIAPGYRPEGTYWVVVGPSGMPWLTPTGERPSALLATEGMVWNDLQIVFGAAPAWVERIRVVQRPGAETTGPQDLAVDPGSGAFVAGFAAGPSASTIELSGLDAGGGEIERTDLAGAEI